jgi:hypothetical protein
VKRVLLFVPLLLLAARSSSGMVLTRETYSDGPPGSYNESLPDWCYHEDSAHLRWWEGRLDPGQSFDVTLQFCPWFLEDGTYAGGSGGTRFYYAASFPPKASFELRVTFPAGWPGGITSKLAWTIQPGWIVGCVLDDAVHSSQWPYPGPAFHVTLTNTGTRSLKPNELVYETIRVDMANDNFRNVLCPAQDR